MGYRRGIYPKKYRKRRYDRRITTTRFPIRSTRGAIRRLIGLQPSFRGALVANSPVARYNNCKFTFTQFVYLPATTTAANYYQLAYAINDIRDPSLGGGTDAALYFNEMMQMYGRYIVHGSKIQLELATLSDVSSTGDQLIALVPCVNASQAALITDIETAAALPRSKSHIISRQANQVYRVSMYQSTKSLYGKHNIADDPQFIGNASSSPSTIGVWNISAATAAGGANDVSLYGKVKITYYVTLMRDQTVSQVAPS